MNQLDKDIAALREIKCLPRMYEAYGPKLTRILDALEEAREVIGFYGDVLQARCRMKEHDDGAKARAFLAKYGEGEK